MTRRARGIYDIVIVGFGGAGAAAAITAHDLGASVAIVEKQPEDGHTPSTKLSGGVVMTITDVYEGARYLTACAGGMVPETVAAAWAQRAHGLRSWLTSVTDLTFVTTGGAEHPELPGARCVEAIAPGRKDPHDPSAPPRFYSGAGRDLFAAIERAVRARDIDIYWNSPASRLVRSAEGRVEGVVTSSPEGEADVRARHGVVLTCGGYEYDERMKLNYLRAYPVYFYGNPGNSGDGVRLAQSVGADLWHMNQMIGRGIGSFPLADGERLNVILTLDPKLKLTGESSELGYVICDKFGHRFADEYPQARMEHAFYYHLITYDSDRLEYPRIPCYWLFDERRRRAGPLTFAEMGLCGAGYYRWSEDNHEEIDRGWIARGATPEEAAARAGVLDAAAVADTVARYNAACATGRDTELGRPPETMVALDEPPYYCVPLWPGGSNTSGGPVRDHAARVLDVYGDPIPGLYAAGELGEAIGLLYPCSGGNISDALCFGPIAAESALPVTAP
jgi:hypothetical protein